MDRLWIIVFGLVLICSSHLVRTQDTDDEEVEMEDMPPVITAQMHDVFHFRVDDDPIGLDCEAKGTSPLDYKWEQIRFDENGERIVVRNLNEDPEAKVSGSSLMIDVGQATDQGLYQCTVTNPHGTTISKIVEVSRMFIKRPKKDPKQFVATEGAYFRIPCDESKSFPPARFSWKLKKDTADPGEEVRPDGRVSVAGDGALMFANVREEDDLDNKYYQCNQYNPASKVTMGGRLNTLSVTGPASGPKAPRLEWSTPLEGDRVVLGKNARVQCIFSGNPTPSIRWTFRPKDGADDEEVPAVLEHPPAGEGIDPTALWRKPGIFLGEKDPAPPPEGVLSCIGSNSEGDKRKDFNIKIEYPPRLATAPSGRRVQEGDEVIFVCAADGNPKPDIKFIINGKDVDREKPGPRRSVSSTPMTWDPYREENSEQLVLIITGACRDSDDVTCDIEQDVFSIQCNASNIHGSVLGSGYLSVYEKPSEGDEEGEEAETAEGAASSKDPNACTDPEVLTSVGACRDTYQDAVKNQTLCMAYCHYTVCVSELRLSCNPPSIGDRSFCYGLCIEHGLMEDPEKPGREKKYKGLSKKVITIICILVLVLIVLLLLFVLYKIYKKRQQRRKYKGVSAVYKPTTEA